MNESENRTQVALPNRPHDDRAERIAEGIALIAAGNSERWSADHVGLAKTTLHDAYHRIRSAQSDQQKEALDTELISHAILNANLAGQELSRRLSDPKQLAGISSRDLGTLYGIHVDKVSLKRRWARPEDTSSDGWLDQLGSALARVRSVTIELNDPAQDAIDVTPLPDCPTG